MKKILLVSIVIALCISTISGCSVIERIGTLIDDFGVVTESDTGALLSICNGYLVKTNSGYFFVADEDSDMLKKHDFLQIKPCDEEMDFSAYQTGDKVEIGIYTVEESYPMQATVYKFTYKVGKYVFEEMSMSVFEKLEELGYEIILRDSDLIRPLESEGGYGIYLPASKQTVKIFKQYERYITIIDEEMVRAAELKLLENVRDSESYSFYIGTDEQGYLCLGINIVRKVNNGDDSTIEHEHVSFYERITK